MLRAAGRPEEARRYDVQAREGLIKTYGDRHPFTLAAGINYASDLAACGELGAAIQLGQETLAKCRVSLGDDHPDTLMAAANLAIDEAAVGEPGSGRADARRRAAPVRADADHRTSRGAGGGAADPPHRGDRAVLICTPAEPGDVGGHARGDVVDELSRSSQ